MVASVAAKGYKATSVADLLKISGVSRATFYAHFADKEACFVATIEAILDASGRRGTPRMLTRAVMGGCTG